MSRGTIFRWGVFVGLLGVMTWSLTGCDLKEVVIPGPQGISTAQYILRLSLVPDIIDINDFGTSTSNLRAHLTDWNGSNLAGKTILFEVMDITITFGADAKVSSTVRTVESQQDCSITGTPPRCDLTSCTAPIVTADNTNTTVQETTSSNCVGIVNSEIFGRINPRKVKTGANGMATSKFTPFGSFKVKTKLAADLFDDSVECLAIQLNISTGTETTTTIEETDLDGDGINDICRVTTTTTTTTANVSNLITNFPNEFDVPIRATWIEADHPDQVTDTNNLRLMFPQWNND